MGKNDIIQALEYCEYLENPDNHPTMIMVPFLRHHNSVEPDLRDRINTLSMNNNNKMFDVLVKFVGYSELSTYCVRSFGEWNRAIKYNMELDIENITEEDLHPRLRESRQIYRDAHPQVIEAAQSEPVRGRFKEPSVSILCGPDYHELVKIWNCNLYTDPDAPDFPELRELLASLKE